MPSTQSVAKSLKTIVMVKGADGTFKPVRREMIALGLSQPPVGDAHLESLAREIYRRALYQNVPVAERRRWSEPNSGVSARPLVFDGMTDIDIDMATPEGIMERYIAMVARKGGAADADQLRTALGRAKREYNNGEIMRAASTAVDPIVLNPTNSASSTPEVVPQSALHNALDHPLHKKSGAHSSSSSGDSDTKIALSPLALGGQAAIVVVERPVVIEPEKKSRLPGRLSAKVATKLANKTGVNPAVHQGVKPVKSPGAVKPETISKGLQSAYRSETTNAGRESEIKDEQLVVQDSPGSLFEETYISSRGARIVRVAQSP